MKCLVLPVVLLLFVMFVFTCGCTEPPIKDPTVSVRDIALSDVSFQTMTVNTTVVINNPNPIRATLNKVAFDVYYLDEDENYLGHGEKTGIAIKENGNTTVTIPVIIGTIPAIQAVGSLVKRGSITLKVNGSVFIDVKVTSFEKRFEQKKQFQAADFEAFLPAASFAGTSINVTEKVEQARGLLDILSG